MWPNKGNDRPPSVGGAAPFPRWLDYRVTTGTNQLDSLVTLYGRPRNPSVRGDGPVTVPRTCLKQRRPWFHRSSKDVSEWTYKGGRSPTRTNRLICTVGTRRSPSSFLERSHPPIYTLKPRNIYTSQSSFRFPVNELFVILCLQKLRKPAKLDVHI